MGRYLVAHYLPTTLFSLKDSQATNAAGKTLLVPSPYAVKMALLDVTARSQGVGAAKAVFIWLKSLEVRPSPPQYACVSNAFIKIQKPWQSKESGAKAEEARKKAILDGKAPFQPTVAFREYAQFQGELRIALEVSTLKPEEVEILKSMLLRINYFGKRGCFMQFTQFGELEELDETFITMTGDQKTSSGSVMHYLDDFGAKMTWEKVNVYLKDKPDRETKAALLPYQLKRSSKRSSLYTRVV
ncbi:hypothetical protein [Meiothermus sp.]|uniref:hypothetical protein n=1 Tax=Meiothermus sp. TaxID=1955249 RepID=UPI0021DE71BC|nr:hypothetical protein [Meiothermus sp.]GIW26187.1 MAG: hypothetical protein KatS3mg069_2454 [Meiothermus sp.]